MSRAAGATRMSRTKSKAQPSKGELPTSEDIERFKMTDREIELITQLTGNKTCQFLDNVDMDRKFEDHYVPITDRSGEPISLGSGVYGSVFQCRACLKSGEKVRAKTHSSVATSAASSAGSSSSSISSAATAGEKFGPPKRSSGKRASAFFSKLFSSFSSSAAKVADSTVSTDSDSAIRFAAKKIVKSTMFNSSSSVKVRLRYLRSMRSEVGMLQLINERDGRGKQFVSKMVDVFESSEHIIIVTEYYTGGELYQYMKERELDEERVARLAYQLTQAINFIHEDCSAVHCDIKPENVMFEDDSHKTLRLIDFGMARVVKPDDLLSDPCGSAYYTAPEVINTRSRKAAYSQPCDVWALGCLVFVLLYGYPPFAIDTSRYQDSTAMKRAIYRNILDGFFPRVYSAESVGYGPWFPDTLPKSAFARDFIAKCLVQDPAKRTKISKLMDHPWFYSLPEHHSRLESAKVIKIPDSDAGFKSSSPVLAYEISIPSSSFVQSVILNSLRSISSQSSYTGGGGGITPSLDSPVISDESSIASRRKSIFPSPPSSELATEEEMVKYLQSALMRFDRRAWDFREVVVYIARVEIIEAWPQLFDCLLRMFKNMSRYQRLHSSPPSVVSSDAEGEVSSRKLRSDSRSTGDLRHGGSTEMVDFRSFKKVFRGEDRIISRDACKLVWSKLTQPSIFRLANAYDGSSVVTTPKSLDYICFDDLVTAVVMDYITHIPRCVDIAFDNLCQLCTQITCGFPGRFGNSSLLTLSMSEMSPGMARKPAGFVTGAMGTSLSEFPFPDEYKCETIDLSLVLDYVKQDKTTHSGSLHLLSDEQWAHLLHELSIRFDKDSSNVGSDEFNAIFQSAFV